ncbi:Multidrug resistance-associated protein 1 [Terramyces sp. JEL0728]|nr:Multidrug resistance-associated protein 1 [Terramyces sp. JEL0728]
MQVSSAPVSGQVVETLDGLKTIRALKKSGDFIKELDKKKDVAQTSFYNLISVNRWVYVQMLLLSNLVLASVAVFSVTFSTNTALIGVALLNCSQLTSLMSAILRQYTFMENSMVSLERIMQYDIVEEESNKESTNLDESWPQKGKIEFVKYETKYSPTLHPVIQNLSVSIKGGEKIGVVGRTGAGKSSLALALFRILEATDGRILIDDLDISEIGLQDLRTRLTILPQDPFLFEGTVRENMDPAGHFDDEAIWNALRASQMDSFVSGLEGKLTAQIKGDALSVGQNQLLCLARAFLRKSSILVLDEATASVDHQTDKIIQNSIRSEFAGRTIFTIAHRIGTIIDYDKILVLSNGNVAEFDTPENLIAKSDSLFASLVKESGLE